jgi:hypothetical protein
MTNTDLVTTHRIAPDLVRDMGKVEGIIERCSPEAMTALTPMFQTVVLANGINDLREAMSEALVKKVFMPLAGTKLGFRTDQDSKGGYSWDVVRDVVIEAMMRGFRPVGNEFNIIGSNFYATQEGLDRRVSEFPGLTNLSLIPGVPVLKDGGALVAYEASWLIDGKPDHLSCTLQKTEDGEIFDQRIPVRLNNGQGADATLGKAKRKMLARVYERISGVRIPEGDVDSSAERLQVANTPAPAPPELDGKRMSLGKGRAQQQAPDAEVVPQSPPAEKRMREPGED